MNRVVSAFLILTAFASIRAAHSAPIGTHGHVGCSEDPIVVDRLIIDQPGVYENYLVDSDWADGNRVKITADNVVLRNCEIRNATGNGIGVFGNNVLIENCKIHHLLAGTFEDQKDAHGITGFWGDLMVRNCDIYLVSGDCIQFDPSRKSQGKLTIEGCHLWAGALPADAAGFRKGERPGENALDTKTPSEGDPSEIVMRDCLVEGWRQPAPISNVAALNLKENVKARIENCVFRDNEIAFRIRGPGARGGAEVAISRCAIFGTETGVRMEDKVRNLKIDGLGFGPRVDRRIRQVGEGPFPGFVNEREFDALDAKELCRTGIMGGSRRQ